MTDLTPTDEQQDVREAYAALQRLFDAAKPSVANRRAGKDAMMRDVQTVTRALAARAEAITGACEDADAVLIAVADHDRLVGVLAEHQAVNDSDGDFMWCANPACPATDTTYPAHLADVVRAWLRDQT